ncbi:hypothetical protein OAO55_02945 [Bacteroidales bacterium]|nr:hypothetical protein [Bacteroidales bacterium]
MKQFLFFLAMALFAVNASAKIVYLNNNVEKDATKLLFATFSDAYLACDSGEDTIYVAGSNTAYGHINVDKKLTIIGPGYFLDKNPDTQVGKVSAWFDEIRFSEGCNNSIIKGLGQYSTSSSRQLVINGQIDGLTIESCYIPTITIKDYDSYVIKNITIKKCYIWYGGIVTYSGSSYDGTLSNFTLLNNIVFGQIFLSNGSDGIINNNLFTNNIFQPGANSSFEIHNNILLAENKDGVKYQPINSSVSHNISIIDAFGSTESNQSLVSLKDLFVKSEGDPVDNHYILANGSPAIGTANDGGDIGPFGGPDPYILSGLPNLPNIYEITTGGFVSGDQLKVRVKVKQ